MPRNDLRGDAYCNKSSTQLGRDPSLDEIITSSQSKSGQDKTREFIFGQGGLTYSADPENPNLLLERSADGTIRRGNFVSRQFILDGLTATCLPIAPGTTAKSPN